MSLYKRGKVWWARFTTPNGERIRESTGTEDRKQAQEYHDRLKAKYWEVQKLGEKPERSWQDAVVRWLDETSHKASQHDDVHHLRWLDPHLGNQTLKGKHPVRVFTYRGKPVREVNTKAWRHALKRLGIEDFRWHDLRHTWASWHVQSGTPLHVLQELGAWESVEMVRRYAHLGQNHLADYAEKLCRLKPATDTNLAQKAG